MESILYPEFLYGHLLHGNLKKKKKKRQFWTCFIFHGYILLFHALHFGDLPNFSQ